MKVLSWLWALWLLLLLWPNRSAFEDVRSLVALNGDYATAEEFIKWDYDLRIQKIGNTYRAFRRVSTNWKGNVGNSSTNEDIPVTPEVRHNIIRRVLTALFGDCACLAAAVQAVGGRVLEDFRRPRHLRAGRRPQRGARQVGNLPHWLACRSSCYF